MLILTRKPGESIYVGDVKVTILEMKGNQIRVGIDAPPEVRIYREEIYLQILEENRKAAQESVMPADFVTGDIAASIKESVSAGGASGNDEAGSKKRKGKQPSAAPVSAQSLKVASPAVASGDLGKKSKDQA